MLAQPTGIQKTTLTPDRLAGDPVEYAQRLLYVLDKQKRKRRLEYNRAQRHYLNNRTRHDLILKARQMGFSTVVQAELFRIVTTRAATTLTMAHEDEQTQVFRRRVDFFYDNLPDPRPKRKYANAGVTTYPGMHSEARIGTAGNVAKGRGDTYTHFHGSEVAFWPDAESIVAGAMQGGNPAVVLESTPNGAQGYYYDLCMGALDGSNEFKLHFYPWWWDDGYRLPLLPEEVITLTDEEAELVAKHGLDAEQIKWRRTKQRELKHLFQQEYPEDPVTCFLLSGEGYFGDITLVKKSSRDLTPDSSHRYRAGLDFGQTTDYTVLSVIDRNTKAQVDLLRINRLSWKEMRRRVIERCKYWGVDVLLAEENSMGSTNIEDMREEMGEAECSTALIPFHTDNSSKASIMSELHEAMHSGALAILDDPTQSKELRVFQASQTKTGLWQLSAPPNEHDDTVIALALAWEAQRRPAPNELVDWA